MVENIRSDVWRPTAKPESNVCQANRYRGRANCDCILRNSTQYLEDKWRERQTKVRPLNNGQKYASVYNMQITVYTAIAPHQCH